MTSSRQALSVDDRDRALRSLPRWSVLTGVTSGDSPAPTSELHRTYRFHSFDDALAFMQAAAPVINRIDHHPRWENSYRTVAVWLSTWDAGHSITALDVDLARHLDETAARFLPGE
ncbi:MAG: 4a-hydroxytetrahydrobiopterin dehydratase [Vicinamibacterales bacterium]